LLDGQASIDSTKCILCGTCLKECPQGAKKFRLDIVKVKKLLKENSFVAVSIAPSFPAVYTESEIKRIPSMLRSLGFSNVSETSVGAGVIADGSAEYFSKNRANAFATACPSFVNYIEKYDGKSIDNLIPLNSPMIAHAKLLKSKFGEDIKVVFIGPCIAKKHESERQEYKGIVDAVLTFTELNDWISDEGLNFNTLEESEFDASPSGYSRYFPLVGGLAKTAEINLDILDNENIIISGIDEIKDCLNSIISNSDPTFVEPLMCKHGCINGPGITGNKSNLLKRKNVIDYAESKSLVESDQMLHCDFETSFNKNSVIEIQHYSEEQIRNVLEKTGKVNEEDQLNCGACGYNLCRDQAIAVLNDMAEVEMCIPFMRKLAEQRSDKIIETTPNLMDPEPFVKLKESPSEKLEFTLSHNNYNITCHHILYELLEEKQYVGIFVDITKRVSDSEKLDDLKLNTIRQAQELMDHQIEVAQQLAKFLGESTARGEELVDNLLKLTQDEQINNSVRRNKGLWNTYISK
jgi:iron only hydrogenase large subunit-like protein